MDIECLKFSDVKRMIERLVGEPCMRKEVGEWKSLSLGFGPEKQRAELRSSRIYRAWELGTYRSCWRIIQNDVVLCGHRDLGDNSESNITLGNIDLGRFASMQHLNELDLRIEFDNGIKVDFLSTFSDEDEAFHIFCPGNCIIEYSVRHGWVTGPSDKPWIRRDEDSARNNGVNQDTQSGVL